MDARGGEAAADSSAIWVAASIDGGRTFGPNVRASPAGAHYHRLPSLAIGEAGRLHLAWETDQGSRQVLAYATSDDGGATFGARRAIVASDDGTRRGKPTLASVVTAGGRVHVTWVDSLGAHVATWRE
jgi:hypothetical protein